MTLVEPADGMREISRKLNPECTHLAGDMRNVRLGRTFDAVFVHDAIMYMTTEVDLRATWLRLFDEVGLAATLVPRIIEGEEYDSFVAVRAAT
jgi:trans-aconitate methyltransferase